MKFDITFKDPDAVSDAVQTASQEFVDGIDGLSKSERDCLLESRQETLNEVLEKWLTYGELITIQFDTDAMTATVKSKV